MSWNDLKNGILAALAAAGSFIANQVGGWDAALGVLVALMAVDYLTGIISAAEGKSNKSTSGTLSSAAGWKGLVRKGVILLIVWVGALLDELTGAAYVRTAVILFFVGNEGLSVAENVGLIGVPLPKFLKKMLEALREQNDDRGGADGQH